MIRKIKKLYNDLSIPLKATIWYFICQMLQKMINMVTTPVFARVMSKYEYGKVGSFDSWLELLFILLICSVWKATLNVYKENDKSDELKDRLLKTILSFSCLMTLVWIGLVFFLYHFIVSATGLSLTLIICLICCAFSQNVNMAWVLRQQYDYKYMSVVVYSIITAFVSNFGSLIMVCFFGASAENKIIPQALCSCIASLIIVIRYLLIRSIKYDLKQLKYCLVFAVPLIPHYLSEYVLNSSDRIMIDKITGSENVATYTIAYAVGSLVLIVCGAVNSAFIPYQYQKINDSDYLVLARNTNVIIAFIACCSCIFTMFAKEIILIFGSAKYIDGISLVAPISVGIFFNFVFQLFARVQEYFEQKHTVVIGSVLCAILNIILNYLFIPVYGYQAAAYTTATCYFNFCFLHYLFYRIACKKNIGVEIYNSKGLAIISILFIVVVFLIRFIDKVIYLKYFILLFILIMSFVCRKKIVSIAKQIKGGEK